MNNSWDVGQFFNVSMLASDVGKAVQAAERLFKLKPPIWWVIWWVESGLCVFITHVNIWSCSERFPPGGKGVNAKNNNSCYVFPSDLFIKAKLGQKEQLLRPCLVLCDGRERQTDRHPHTECIPTCYVSKTKLSALLIFSGHIGLQEQNVLGYQYILCICEKADSKAKSTPRKRFSSQMKTGAETPITDMVEKMVAQQWP